MMISVIIPVGLKEELFFKRVSEIHSTIGDVEYEIIAITIDKNLCSNNPDVNICLYSHLNSAEACNYGAYMSKGDILVHTDAHTEFPMSAYGWGEVLERFFETKEDAGVVSFPRYTLYGDDMKNPERHMGMIARGLRFRDDMNLFDVEYITPLDNGEIPFIWGDFQATRREVFFELGGRTTEGGGAFDDRNICITASLFGYTNYCINDGPIIGAYIRKTQTTYVHHHLGNMCAMSLHYTGERLERAKEYWKKLGYNEFDIVYNRWQHLREYYLKRRVHDDNWYFKTFLKKFR